MCDDGEEDGRGEARLRRLAYAAYGFYLLGGMTSVILGALMPELLHHYGVDYGAGGRVVFMQAFGFLAGVPLASYLTPRLALPRLLALFAGVVAVAQWALWCLPPFGLVYAIVYLNGIGASALETAVAAFIMESVTGRRALFMSRMEVSFGLGAVLLPALASGLIAIGWWRDAFSVTGGLAVLLGLLVRTATAGDTPAGDPRGVRDREPPPPPFFPSRRAKGLVLAIFLFMTFLYVGLEGSLNGFLPSIFHVGFHTAADLAALTVTLFWLAMVAGRIAIAWVARHLSYDRYLVVSIAVALGALVALSRSRSLGFGFVWVAVLGLGMAAIYSVLMTYANHSFPGRALLVTALVTAVAGLGGAVFPALVGHVMDHWPPTAILWGLAAIPALLGLALFTILTLFRYLRARPG